MTDEPAASQPSASQEGRRHVQALVRRLIAHLDPGEHLGTPRRADDEIIIPIVSDESDRPADPVSVRALLEAWLD